MQKMQLLTIFLFSILLSIESYAQNDDATNIINTAYTECFGHNPSDSELKSYVAHVQSNHLTLNDIITELKQYLKQNDKIQRDVIKYAYIDALGDICSPTEEDGYFNSRVSQDGNVWTYKELLASLKIYLSANLYPLELTVIKRSYKNYFGIDVTDDDVRVKNWMNSAISANGDLYKDLMEQHRLSIIQFNNEQKAVINRSYKTAFNRDATPTEMNSWFAACKSGGCSYVSLLEQHYNYIRTHQAPVTPPQSGHQNACNKASTLSITNGDPSNYLYLYTWTINSGTNNTKFLCNNAHFEASITPGSTYKLFIPAGKTVAYKFYQTNDCSNEDNVISSLAYWPSCNGDGTTNIPPHR